MNVNDETDAGIANPEPADCEDPAFRRAVAALAEDLRVLAVYAFGSRARGEERPDSDFDLAILLGRDRADDLSLREELRLRARAVDALGSDRIDVVVLDHARPELRYEIISTGERLFCRDPNVADRFEGRTALKYFDTAHLRAVQRDLAREALR